VSDARRETETPFSPPPFYLSLANKNIWYSRRGGAISGAGERDDGDGGDGDDVL